MRKCNPSPKETPKETTAESVVTYLQTSQAVRDRTQKIFELSQADRLDHFTCNLSQLDTVVHYVIETTQQSYPDLNIPFHSRWRHFDTGGISRLANLHEALQPLDRSEKARSLLDLAIVSVLLDAGAGNRWHYRDTVTESPGVVLSRSEGLAVASLRAFEQGFFSSDSAQPHRVDAQRLQQISEAELAQLFQVSESNPLVGLSGRLTLLHQLGATLAAQPDYFGTLPARPGKLLDYLTDSYGTELEAGLLLTEVLKCLGPIWPGRVTVAGVNLGDVWPHPALGDSPPQNLVPFHKLSQWLTYSLVEPLVTAGMTVANLNALTGLAEYRNGGLCVDLGLLVPKHSAVTDVPHLPGSPVVVEWRALTLAMLDLIGDRVCNQLNKSLEELPLLKVLEGGTWAAGRRIAKQLRPSGGPPIAIKSDGTVF
ncbi:MAG: URC4/urg3 family protein [Cyanobacteria bacterium J06606_4]